MIAASAPSHASMQTAQLLLAPNDFDAGRQAVTEPGGDDEPDTVVTAVLVADADHHVRHRRSTSSVRKWVAHEMQGS